MTVTDAAPTAIEANAAGKVLVLRSCHADGSSHNDWKYPLTEGAVVEAPDWNPKPKCGGGFHGLPWGVGDNSLMYWDDDAWWQVFECDAADVVKIDDSKCKFRRGVQVFLKQHLAPGFALAQAFLIANDNRKNSGRASASGYCGSASASGYYGSASASGYYGSASASGNSGRASASGDYGRASASGNSGRASASGNSGRASASGNYGSASASGTSGRASASGNYGRASASGKQSIAACIGYEGRAMAGEDGCLVIAWHDGKRPRVCVGYVGEDGIEAGKWYQVRDGQLAEAKP